MNTEKTPETKSQSCDVIADQIIVDFQNSGNQAVITYKQVKTVPNTCSYEWDKDITSVVPALTITDQTRLLSDITVTVDTSTLATGETLVVSIFCKCDCDGVFHTLTGQKKK